jgi:hypothetical protein
MQSYSREVKEIYHKEYIGVDGSLILQLILNGMDGIHLAESRDQWRISVDAKVGLRVV